MNKKFKFELYNIVLFLHYQLTIRLILNNRCFQLIQVLSKLGATWY